MDRNYIENCEGGYRISGTRVSLDSIVYAFLEGLSPESIVDDFPVLSLEEVYGAIAYYLGHRQEVDAHLAEIDKEFQILRERVCRTYPLLNRMLDQAKERQQTLTNESKVSS